LTDSKFKSASLELILPLIKKLPFGFVGTIEGIYQTNINAINYYNANLDAPVGTFTGPDNRPVYGRTMQQLELTNAIVQTQ
jgi:hypothetical protein